MHILRFSTGFNMMFDPDRDVHVLQQAVDHYVRVNEDPGLESTYSIELEFSAGRIRLNLQELALLEASQHADCLWIEDQATGERHRFAVIPTQRVHPRSQHETAQAMDVAADRPTHVTITTARGPTQITTGGDLPVLRRYFEENFIDGQQMAVPVADLVIDLPDAGTVRLRPEEIRRMCAALVNARQIEQGTPLRAVANVDGQNYGQRANETLPEYEQRVIQDIMLRRGRDLMRERGMTPQQAATEVQRMLDEQGVTGLAPDAYEAHPPTQQVEAQLALLTEGDHAILAQAIARYYLDDQIAERAQRLIERVGLTEPMIRWFSIQMVAGQNRVPVREQGPSLMEAWRD
jgi:hypothetical protein